LTGRTLDLHEHDGFVAAAATVPALRTVTTAAHRISDRNGAASLAQVEAESGDVVGVETTLIREFLRACPDVTWLTRDWFWTRHGERRNRLVNTSQRILIAHQPQDLTHMLGGVERQYTWRNSTGGASRTVELQVPPEDILRAFYAAHPDFTTDSDGRIRLARSVPEEILGEEKLTLVRILRDQPWQAMTRNDLIDACVAAGMRVATANVFLTYAECLENIGHNVWALRGTDIPEEVILDLQDDAKARSRSFDLGRRQGPPRRVDRGWRNASPRPC
jgi:hypothetical protein